MLYSLENTVVVVQLNPDILVDTSLPNNMMLFQMNMLDLKQRKIEINFRVNRSWGNVYSDENFKRTIEKLVFVNTKNCIFFFAF